MEVAEDSYLPKIIINKKKRAQILFLVCVVMYVCIYVCVQPLWGGRGSMRNIQDFFWCGLSGLKERERELR